MSSVIRTAERAADRTRSSLADLGTQALKLVDSLRTMETRRMNSLLDRMGLQRRQSALRPALWFAAGAASAGAIVLLFAPESGKKLRDHFVQLLEQRGARGTEPPAEVAAATPASHGDEQELAH